tara:strand:+ start:1624 stop:1857 length:234 start_codon:yes stop_codon:yes gene_type:complete
MSFNEIVNKLLTSMKEEIEKEENMIVLKNDIIKPIVEQVLLIVYPYFIGISIIFLIIIIVIFMILFLNIKICYSKFD